MTDSIA